MKSEQEILEIIHHSNCTEAYHEFSPFPRFPVATDGVIALAEAAECYWLLDIIGSYQTDERIDQSFQMWTLEVNLEAGSGVVRGYNDTDLIITQEIPFTDFPLEEVELYLMDGIILLPSEY
ncbi:hypothetical protein LJC63_00975 [Ruminococcaceae bacterium OttesenSCG-928-L11]|nr:hypothetical protein [Ruminococcaceae bacterium OttesenSCG-928-L11]